MKIIAELLPSTSRTVVMRRAKAISDYTNLVDIPDSPGGRPSAHAVAVAYIAKESGLDPIAHIRLRDLNLLAYRSILGAAKLFELERVVLLMGDPPEVGQPVDHLNTEAAVVIAREYGFKVGVLLSMKRNYAERIKIGADFYLVLNLERPSRLEELAGLEAYPYLLIRTEKNAELISRLRQPAITLESLRAFMEGLESYAKGVILSAPGDFEAELLALSLAAKR
ncbi:MAG: 5,10-methylenetetrahydrofolate reductase [Thermoproteus sp.]